MKPSFDREERYQLRVPGRARRYLEVRALMEFFLLVPAAPILLSQNRGDGRQIMLLPGFLADDTSTWPLRHFLDYLGYEALPWNQGRNQGQPEADADRVIAGLRSVRRPDEPITLIGWSLGGVIAREVARRTPGIVREVITLGTPVEGGPKYTAAGRRFAKQQNIDLDAFERHVHEINQLGISCPLTVIYSHGDGIVDWRAAIDRYNPQARHERVVGSHLGLGVNPLVWRLIARTLSASPGV
jgi:pimeloyl-ACP methyl ester carboxylesterase